MLLELYARAGKLSAVLKSTDVASSTRKLGIDETLERISKPVGKVDKTVWLPRFSI